MSQLTSNQENSLPTSNEVTMLPCPFCGNTQATIFEHFKDAHYFYANCIGCDAEGPPALSSKEARDAWNQRGRSSHETVNDPGIILNELWRACRVVFYPELGDLRGDYPIEHAPGAAKDARDLIEARLAERILQRAKSSQKAGEEP